MDKNPKVVGMLARYESAGALLKAAEKLRDSKYSKFDCHSPFPIHGMDDAMGLKRSPVGYFAGLGGTIGLSVGLGLQWWTSTVGYPLVISGKPLNSYQAFIPVAFGLTILFAALGAFAAMLIFNKMPQFWHIVFHSDQFAKFSDDGFFVSVEATDPKFDEATTRVLLESIGGTDLEVLQES